MKNFLFIALLFVIVGCSSQPVTGIVTAKHFIPAHDNLVMMPITISDGTNITTTFIPVWFHEPDRWTLTVEPYDQNGNPLRVRTLMVRKDIYETVTNGEWYTDSPEKLDTSRATKIVGK